MSQRPRRKSRVRDSLGPTIWEEVDPFLGKVQGLSPTVDGLLIFLCDPHLSPDLARFRADYLLTLRQERETPIFNGPYKERVFSRLIWPLRHAKASFLLGNYLGTIALSGLVAEMLAVLALRVTGGRYNGELMDTEVERKAFGGKTFDQLSQRQRLNYLESFKLIDRELRSAFNEIHGIRRRQLHFFEQGDGALKSQALRTYTLIVRLSFWWLGTEAVGHRSITDPQAALLWMRLARENKALITRRRPGRAMIDQTRSTAFHEAGHAVMSVEHGFGCGAISIKASGDPVRRFSAAKFEVQDLEGLTPEAAGAYVAKVVAVLMAGFAAQSLAEGEESWAGSEDDRARAIDLCTSFAGSRNEAIKLMREIAQSTKRELRQVRRWRAVSNLAEQLYDREALSGEETAVLIAPQLGVHLVRESGAWA